MSECDDDYQRIKELKLKRISSFLSINQKINTSVNVRLYTCCEDGTTWLDSRLEGILCLVSDYSTKTFHLFLFHSFNYSTLFKYELYKGAFHNITLCSPEFLALEVDNGFLGFQFYSSEECESLMNTFNEFEKFDDNYFLVNPLSNKSMNILEKSKELIQYLKDKSMDDDFKKYSGDFIEDGIEIIRSRNLEILGSIEYDEDLCRFKFEDLNPELEEIFKSIGIKKKDLENPELGYALIQKVILLVSSKEDLKEKVFGVQNIHWTKPTKIKKKEQGKDGQNTQNTTNTSNTPNTSNTTNTLNTTNNPNTTNSQNISNSLNTTNAPNTTNNPNPTNNQNKEEDDDLLPPPSDDESDDLKPPPDDDIEPTVKKPKPKPVVAKTAPKKLTESAPPTLSFAEQIKNVKLRKVEKPPEPKLVTATEKSSLQVALSLAIANRFRNLKDNEDSSDSDSDDD